MMKTRDPQVGEYAGGRYHLYVLWFICLLAVLSGCSQTPTPTIETTQFVVFADTSTGPLMEELVDAFRASRAHVDIQFENALNTERVLETLLAGRSDLVSVSWLPEGVETENRFWHRPFARDSIVMITHPTNPVGGLTLLQLRSIFQGQTLLWTDLDGPDIGVIPVSREDGAGTRLSFDALVLGKRSIASTAVVMPSNKAVVDYVSVTPGAIGYVASAWLAPSVNLLVVEGTTPSRVSVEDGRYLLARPLFLVARTEPVGGLGQFVDWIREGGGQEIIKRNYALVP